MSQETAPGGAVVSVALAGELEEKLLLHDGAPPPAKCSSGAALQKRGGVPDDVVDYRERFVRAYDRLRNKLVADDSFEQTNEAKRWVAQMIDYNVPGGEEAYVIHQIQLRNNTSDV